jgi:hypothetical protein
MQIESVESALLDLADFIYAHTPLKPMSKALFFISRMLVLAKRSPIIKEAILAGVSDIAPELLTSEYAVVARDLHFIVDDYDFPQVLLSLDGQLSRIMAHLKAVVSGASGSDVLGLAFNSLLRGKFEAGEGLGTHLTPEEVVIPMCEAAWELLDEGIRHELLKGGASKVAADITAGTGRFMFHLHRFILQFKPDANIGKKMFLFDQSKVHTEFADINFILHDHGRPATHWVQDSLVAEEVSGLRNRCAVLLTNPPFGVGKYSYSDRLAKVFGPIILDLLGIGKPGDTIDPAWLFIVRNLELLCDGGVLGMILPNGIAHSEELTKLLLSFEKLHSCALNVDAVFSLPTVTFALGGTVAKTSVVFITKNTAHTKLSVADISHIGFDKAGNKRVSDPSGNELALAIRDFCTHKPGLISTVTNWRKFPRLSPSLIGFNAGKAVAQGKVELLMDLTLQIKEPMRGIPANIDCHFHVSILDVDETGVIDLSKCRGQMPSTPPQICAEGDVLISCLNPNIWRVTFIPNLGSVSWSCSPEFAVLRPRKRGALELGKIFLSLHQKAVRDQVVAMGRGTSSSRQRVRKSDLNDVHIPCLMVSDEIVVGFVETRAKAYKNRLDEISFLSEISKGYELASQV